MSVILIEDGVVVQKWMDKKLAQLQEKYPSADLRKDDAVCGQLDNGDGTYRNPDPIPKTDAEIEYENLTNMNNNFKKFILHAFNDINNANSSIFTTKTKNQLQAFIDQLRTP